MSNMDLYKKKYKEAMDRMELCVRSGLKITPEYIFPELAENKDERIRKALKQYFVNSFQNNGVAAICGVHVKDVLAWLEKQGEKHPDPYNGISFEYNGHIWGMCARDNGVDISCDKHLIKHLEKQAEVKETAISQHENRPCEENVNSLTYEDEKVRKELIRFVKGYFPHETSEQRKAYLAWLEKQGSLKRWKPSDEQMKLLSEVQSALLGKDCHNRFTGFMWELKKLKDK